MAHITSGKLMCNTCSKKCTMIALLSLQVFICAYAASLGEYYHDSTNVGYEYLPPAQHFQEADIQHALELSSPSEAELHFVHQELGSEHKPHRNGAVQRLKLLSPSANAIVKCANAKDLHTIVEERRQKRPKERRLTAYTYVVADAAYFVPEVQEEFNVELL